MKPAAYYRPGNIPSESVTGKDTTDTMFEISFVNLINLFFIAMGIGVCSLCYLQITSSTHLREDVRRYFQLFFLLIILYIMLHLTRQMLDGIPGGGVRIALYTITYLEVLAAGFMSFMMSVLILAASQDGVIDRRMLLILWGLLGIHILILTAGQFGGFIYHFDDQNVYHRSSLYLLSNIAPLVMLLIDAWLLIRFRDNINSRVRRAFWVYVIAPVIAIIAQSAFYGVQFIIFATVGAAVNMFSAIIRNLNERFLAQQEASARIGAELSMATDIQASQLPRLFPAFPNRPEFDVFASMTPAKEVGGDFYDFFLVDDDHVGLVMADVSGKGVPAALFMMISRVLIKAHLQNGESPGETLQNVNDQLCEGNDAQLFVTVWLCVLEISTGKGVAANAGHEHPALCRAGEKYGLSIYRHSPAVAAIEGMKFREHSFMLNPGDSVFVYTDGVTEATNAREELFGTGRLTDALNINPEAAPDETLSNVLGRINAFVAGAEQFDDITMMCLRYNGNQM